MITSRDQLKKRHGFLDTLYWNVLLFVPLFTAVLAVYRASLFWTAGYILLALGLGVVILRYFCTHCPHYTEQEGVLKCMFFWGLPRVFTPRPGPLSGVDKAVSYLAPALLILFPLIWLVQAPGLLIIYILSLIGFMASVKRNECGRCIYYDCPMNQVPESLQDNGHTEAT